MKIGVKYRKDRCGGTVFYEDGRRDQFVCGVDGTLRAPNGNRLFFPSCVQKALETHCLNNCRGRWRGRGRRNGPFSGLGATASEVRSLVSAWPARTMSPYARTYLASLEQAEREYGAEGVQFQVNYILGYLRARTHEQRSAKEQLEEIGKGRR